LRKHRPDPDWARELVEFRSLLEIDDRS
jgi:hypothetical protein